MVNSHSKSFFGQNTGLILQSSSKKDPYIFFQCIKKKANGIWEKPSKGEGKIIKFSLEEIIMILKVLRSKMESWSTYHKYNNSNTPISVNWQEDCLWINIDKYSKKLNEAQIVILKLLMEHILQEKIIFATVFKTQQNEELDTPESHIYVKEEIINTKPVHKEQEINILEIKGKIKRKTEKALLIDFLNGIETWIPKSKIHNEFMDELDLIQLFRIDKWLLKKNKVII
jgi:hypothetical protein